MGLARRGSSLGRGGAPCGAKKINARTMLSSACLQPARRLLEGQSLTASRRDSFGLHPSAPLACVCVCVCVRERERERETLLGNNVHNGGSWAWSGDRRCITLCGVVVIVLFLPHLCFIHLITLLSFSSSSSSSPIVRGHPFFSLPTPT